jgi:exopolysaccharide production protein ExoQ
MPGSHRERSFRQQYLLDGVGKAGRIVENWFAVSALIALAGGLNLLRSQGRYADDVAAGDPFLRTVYASIYGVTLLLLLARPGRFVEALWRQKLLVALLLLIGASFAWSASPDLTLRRAIGTAGASLFGVYLATRFDLSAQLRLLAWTFGVITVASLFVVVVLPHYGISSEFHEGSWRGIFTHKQSLGRSMLLGSLVLFMALRGGGGKTWAAHTLIGASLLLLVMSNSKTALVIAVALAAFYPVASLLRARSPLTLAVLCGAAAIGVGGLLVLIEFRESVVESLGKDLTLTGRTDLWLIVIDVIRERPWLGWGLGAFWTGWGGPSAYVWNAVGWTPPHAHQGLLDLWLEVGLVGVALFTVMIVVMLVKSLRFTRVVSGDRGRWPLMFLAFFILSNIPSSLILEANSIYWAVFVAVAVTVSRGPIARTGRGLLPISHGARPEVPFRYPQPPAHVA